MRVCPYESDTNRTILDGSTLWPSWSFVLVPRWVVCVCDEWCTFCESMGRVERRGVYSGCKAGKCDECEQLSLSNCYCNEAISLKRSETTFAGEWITPRCSWQPKKVDVLFSFSVDGVGCVEIIQLFTRVGSFDVDDLIMNTLGTAAGYLIFAVCHSIYDKKRGRK